MFSSTTLNIADVGPLVQKHQGYYPLVQRTDQTPNYVMTFDDFCAYYLVFSERRDEELAQVVFELLKMSPEHFCNKPLEEQAVFMMQAQDGKTVTNVEEVFMKSDLAWLCRLTGVSQNLVRDFFLTTSFSPNFPVTIEDLTRCFHHVKSFALFAWLPDLNSGFRKENMNLEAENSNKNYERRLSVQQLDRAQQQLQAKALVDDQNDS